MKFRKLIIHNIASIEDAVIDFEAEPLASSEVYLITGKTGAGKSTILDAICLALYADTPRLYNTKMQGVTRDEGKEVKIDDPRQLMRRNTAEAFVTLSFLGSNGVSYEATWSVARAYKKLSGAIKNKSWELRNIDTHLTLTKDAEIKKEIAEAIGLDFNQFCRTTMLAQGEFTRFLNSKDDEKAEILEKITGADIYSRIGAKVYELTAQKKQAWEEAQHRVEGIRTLTDEEIGERKQQMTSLEEQQTTLKAVSDRDTAKCKWIEDEVQLEADVVKAKENLRTAKENVESDAFKDRARLVDDWNATRDARRWMTEAAQAEKETNSLNERLNGLSDTYVKLLGGQLFANTQEKKIDNELEDIRRFLDAEKEKAKVYEKAQTVIAQLNTIAQGRHTIERCNSKIEKTTRLLNDHRLPELAAAQTAANQAQQTLEGEETGVKRMEEAVAALHLQELRQGQDDAKDKLSQIETAKERILVWNDLKAKREVALQKLTERRKELDNKRKRLAEMESPLHDAELKREVCQACLDKQKDSVNKFASAMRLRLHVGDVCPVCRQQITTALPHEEELAKLVASLQKEFDVAEKNYSALLEERMKAEANVLSESKAYERDRQSFLQDNSDHEAEAKAREACGLCDITTLDDNTLKELSAMSISAQKRKDSIGERIKEGEAKDAEVKKRRRQLDNQRKRYEVLAQDMRNAERAVNDCKADIGNVQSLIHAKRLDVETAEQEVRGIVTCGQWATDWNLSPADFSAELDAAAKTYKEKAQCEQSLTVMLGTVSTNNRHVSAVMNDILEAMPSWKKLIATEPKRTEHLHEQVNELYKNVTETLTRRRSATERYQQSQASLEAFLAAAGALSRERLTVLQAFTAEDIARDDEQNSKGREEVVARSSVLSNAERRQSEHGKLKPEMTEDDTLEELRLRIADTARRLEAIGEQKGAISQELKTDAMNKQQKGTLLDEANERKAVYEKWSRLNQLIGNATGSTFRKIAQSYVLASLIQSANHYMKTLSDRYTLRVEPGTFVISIEDAYQGYLSRAASTISGGESFLVSLSLALALSDIGQQWQVDTLFIDEGFGTLSGEPLQKAIDTLRMLHSSSGRHVGIISHVEELKERIPVQIQVNQEGNASSSRISIVPE